MMSHCRLNNSASTITHGPCLYKHLRKSFVTIFGPVVRSRITSKGTHLIPVWSRARSPEKQQDYKETMVLRVECLNI